MRVNRTFIGNIKCGILLVVNKFEFQGTLSTLSQSQYRIPIYLLMIETNLRIAYYSKVMQRE